MSEARKHGSYSFYHLFSGEDMPLQSQDVIHDFFDSHLNEEFISYSEGYDSKKINSRIRYHYYMMDHMTRFAFLHKAFRHIERVYLLPWKERLFPKGRKEIDFSVYYGSQWFSVTDKAVGYLLSNSERIEHIFKNTCVPDEEFLQTMIKLNLELSSHISVKGNLRYISWKDKEASKKAHPHTWTMKDLEELKIAKENGYLFARKFNVDVDSDIIEAVKKI